MDGFDMLDMRHERSWAKWRKDLQRNDPPPFLGPLVSISEAMEALDRSETYVRSRIEDGRLNTWKDPVSKRVWILKDDLDILIGDNRALEEAGKPTRGKKGPRVPREPKPESDDESEDLDAIGGWEHPKPPEIIGGAAIEESARESQARYEQAQRENEEWYAAELAKLEDRDPDEAVRQLQIERGWIAPAPEEPKSVPARLPSPARGRGAGGEGPAHEPDLESLLPRSISPRKQRKQPPRPVSWSNPNPRSRTPPEPYVDPDLAAPSFDDRIIPPFPIGWVGWKAGAVALQVSPGMFLKLVRKHNLQRRLAPTGQPRYLYDSLEIEELAEKRLAPSPPPEPGKRLDWWGSRRVRMELNEFDAWMTVAEAAHLLGVNTRRISQLCNAGKLPCYQEKPGVTGSRLYVPHHHVLRLKERTAASKERAAYEKGLKREASQPIYANQEDYGIDDFPIRGWSKACQKDYGDEYTTRQASNVLGVTKNTVLVLMRRGKLNGSHHPRRGKQKNGRKTWFFKKEQVDALAADPTYRKRHNAWLKGVRRKAGWED